MPEGGSMAGQTYSFRTLVVPGAAGNYAIDIDNTGRISLGYSLTDPSMNSPIERAVLLQHGDFTPIDFPRATSTDPSSVADTETLFGTYTDQNSIQHSYRLSLS